jgi:hypothetical protein
MTNATRFSADAGAPDSNDNEIAKRKAPTTRIGDLHIGRTPRLSVQWTGSRPAYVTLVTILERAAILLLGKALDVAGAGLYLNRHESSI